jgi:heme exporter protein B
MKPGSTAAACVALMRRDLKLVWRRRGDALNPLLFAIIVVALFPLALGPETALLARIAAGTILVAVLLAMLLSLDMLFRSDLEDGSLEQLVLSPHPLSLLLACKIFVQWLTTALPLLAVSPLLAQLLHMPADVLSILLIALALATPLLSLIGAVCVALTVGMRRSGMLLTLLVLPLIMPALIFAAGACDAAQMGLAYTAPLLWLGAWLVVALVLAPLAAATALKISLT